MKKPISPAVRVRAYSENRLQQHVRPHSALGNLVPSEYADRSAPGSQRGQIGLPYELTEEFLLVDPVNNLA
jgi:hypothetical protein